MQRNFLCCLRRREKPQTTISMDEECNKGEIVEDLKAGTKNDGSSDFWSSSTFEKDHSAAQSQRSVSSSGITMINLSDPQTSASSTPEFVNQGLLLWNQIRQQWSGNKRCESQTVVREPRISSNATYDDLLGNNKPFPQPIPLREMIYFLVDIWEQEGLYD
ncbi:uncharacterized protein [Cicer arietinum]|uniref:uncharacterized protein isoform X2 n=1 Tax=Cicer arietinum TaxID=3827 RepID=UPI00032A7F1E